VPALVLDDPGRAPRRRLRYALAATTRRHEIAATLRARVLTEPAATANEVPRLAEVMTLASAEPSAGGAMRLHWRGLAAIAAGDAAAPYLAPWRRLLEGRSATVELDARGQLGAIAFAPPLRGDDEVARDELAQRLWGWVVPLPEEPVGPGARWTAVVVLRQALGVVEQTARYRLVSLRDDTLELEVDARRVGEPQLLDASALAPGATREVVSHFRAVAGRLTLSLDSALPHGTLTVEVRAHQRLRSASGQLVSEVITEDLGALELSSRADEPR
jgi:hypothetical protein